MRYLLALPFCLVLLLNSACTPDIFKGMESKGKQTIQRANLYPYHLNADQSTMYSMELGFHDNMLSCLLLVQPDEAQKNTRIVCTSIFGATILDATISEKGMLIYDCAEQLRHKKVLRLLEKDLQTIFLKNLKGNDFKAKVYHKSYTNNESAIATDPILMNAGYSIKTTKGKYHYKTNEVEQKLTSIATDGKLTKGKMVFEYSDGEFQPNKITIEHPILHLSILLERTE
ncbi:MAG: hypothetical protein MJZ23_07715 [Paludibacteraceae bacterium]|nr:hypothetical protein [Paludibacteraceae bacterium]